MSSQAIETNSELQDKLTQRLGVEVSYHDIWGNEHHINPYTQKALVEAMGYNSDNPQAGLDELYFRHANRWLEPVYVVTQAELLHRIGPQIPEDYIHKTFTWTVTCENGEEVHGTWIPVEHQRHISDAKLTYCQLPILENLPIGYQTLILCCEDKCISTKLIITPQHCYYPDFFEQGEKLWGIALQLYSLKSKRNWGMGDFGDLINVVKWAKQHGANTIGLNPLHELFPMNTHHFSPYSPSSQLTFNSWYLCIENMSNYHTAQAIQDEISSPEWQAKLQQFRDTETVDYPGVLSAKRCFFEKLFADFEVNHLQKQTPLAKEFETFVENICERQAGVALYEAIQDVMHSQNELIYSWQQWPTELKDPKSDAVQAFKQNNISKVNFYLYLQWQTECQLAQVKDAIEAAGLKVGLYMDLAVGVDRSGAQTWLNQSLYADGISVGCPPDALSPNGQDWGLPPCIPTQMKEEAYAQLSAVLARNMQYAGAIRLDHALGLYRLFWIPPNVDARSGAYVYYPFEDIVKLIALESHRNECVIIGEDLGTVTEIVQTTMAQWKMLSYKVLYFEKVAHDAFKRPEHYQPIALVTSGTHDLPTLRGFWEEDDLNIRVDLNLYPTNELRNQQLAERQIDKQALLNILKQFELWENTDIHQPWNGDLCLAVQKLLSQSNSILQLIQLEDIVCKPGQMNVPGTTIEHPNWRMKVDLNIEDWPDNQQMQRIAGSLVGRVGH